MTSLRDENEAQVVAERGERDGVPILHAALGQPGGNQSETFELGKRVRIEMSRGEKGWHENGGVPGRDVLEQDAV